MSTNLMNIVSITVRRKIALESQCSCCSFPGLHFQYVVALLSAFSRPAAKARSCGLCRRISSQATEMTKRLWPYHHPFHVPLLRVPRESCLLTCMLPLHASTALTHNSFYSTVVLVILALAHQKTRQVTPRNCVLILLKGCIQHRVL